MAGTILHQAVEHLATLRDHALAQPPSQWCQAFFLGAAGGLVVLQVLPPSLRGLLMDYGPRGGGAADRGREASGGLKRLLGAATSVGQVPHAWFWHFYLLSVAGSAFWAWQFLGKGRVMAALAERQRAAASSPPGPEAALVAEKELGRVFAAWVMMALQGTRRLYESLFVMRTGSASSMWFVHWALGLAFYAVMSISVWIEGSDAILESWKTQDPARILASRVPSAMALYFWAWFKQNECHRHLAGLKKYTLPTAGLFRFLVCPHYTCECLIYLMIAFVAAPADRWFSGPVICGLAFVVANLGATAAGTRQWYAQKFGAEAVASRWTMVPFVF
ncbi:hypothetical protein LMH87_003550 [Akanthomyces muscarius]|uniref:Polyprenal reductase n=1 Tax=Akanthomyces muscarius TaxID=2231603 RepID=A0A9W8UG84_AKAMU|nr:hypothetical protein LMH87_003550 [Akanthomyces muscarius]KAJ4144676.1 hypothetical protein LMH87_003550 [Akanthomyces muscarius]